MNQNEKKIYNYFKQNAFKLFLDPTMLFSEDDKFQKDLVNIYFPDNVISSYQLKIYKNTEWLIKLDEQDFTSPFGIYKNGNIIYMDDECEFKYVCENIQELPLFLFLYNYNFFESVGKLEEVEQNINEYKIWCRNNNISIDPDNIYSFKNFKNIKSKQYEKTEELFGNQ